MKKILALIAFFIPALMASGQVICFSDSTTIYEWKGTQLPPMIGEATLYSGQYKIIIGGKFLDVQNPEAESVYNCDMFILDLAAQKTYALPLSYFPPFVADQFSGVNYCYAQDNDTAYIMGGFGFDLVGGYETTFPTMTIFPVKTLIDSVVHKKDFLCLFQIVDDPRLALTEGNLVHIGQYFLVYNGLEITPIKEENADQFTVNTWDFRGQLRKFTLSNDEGYLEVDEFQICNQSKVFYQCTPQKWLPDTGKKLDLDRND
jgi:hypothetical protein